MKELLARYNEDWVVTAMHELGHALADLDGGLTVEEVTVDCSWWDGRIVGNTRVVPEEHLRDAYLVGVFAGPVAEDFVRERNGLPSAPDWVWDSHFTGFRKNQGDSRLTPELATREARAIVEQGFAWIEHYAPMLAKYGRLTTRDLHR